MKRFIEGESRTQVTLLPECLDDYVAEENPVRVVDVFVDELDLGALGFEGVERFRNFVSTCRTETPQPGNVSDAQRRSRSSADSGRAPVQIGIALDRVVLSQDHRTSVLPLLSMRSGNVLAKPAPEVPDCV